jgi:drug/metabolite transporter (DMT)-like permease
VFEGVNPFGDFLALLAAFTFVLYSLFLERTNSDIHLIVRTRKIFFYGLTIICVFGFINGNLNMDNTFTPIVVSSVLYLGIVASGICFLMWNYSVKVLGSLKSNLFTYLIPFFTLIIAFIVIDEHLTFAKIVGGVIIVLGVYLSERMHVEKDDL